MHEATQMHDLFGACVDSVETQLAEKKANRCELLVGDARQLLTEMPEGHFDCIVTSPPYWGLRDYGVAGQIGAEPTVDRYITDFALGQQLWNRYAQSRSEHLQCAERDVSLLALDGADIGTA